MATMNSDPHTSRKNENMRMWYLEFLQTSLENKGRLNEGESALWPENDRTGIYKGFGNLMMSCFYTTKQ